MVIVVEHWDRLARFGTEQLDVALNAAARRIVVADLGRSGDDLVRDVIEALTGTCARCGAGNRAMRAVPATMHAAEEASVA